jgi:phage terminase small subunit
MGRRGPQRKPRLADFDSDPDQDLEVPQPPPEVAGSPHALEVWTRTVAAMQKMRTWSEADSATVARYAVLHEMHRRYAAECLAGGDVMETKTGYRSPTPAATMFVKLSASLLATEKALGLPAGVRKEMPVPPGSMTASLQKWLRENN